MNDIAPSKAKSWILASRPKTLLAAFVPVLVGTSAAIDAGKENFAAATVALFCAVMIQIATNYVNDLYDFYNGKDTKKRVGPKRALAEGWISPTEMKVGIFLAFGAAFLAGLYLVYLGGWIIMAVGIISILAGYAYTAGPYPLAYNGLGDIFVFVFFGLVATIGTYYVQTLELNTSIFWLSVPVGLLITNILVINNYRDINEDKLNNKKTLAVIIGAKNTRLQYIGSILFSYLVLIFLIERYDYFVLVPLLSFPFALKSISMIFNLSGKELNKLLELTAKFSALFGVLLSIGLIL